MFSWLLCYHFCSIVLEYSCMPTLHAIGSWSESFAESCQGRLQGNHNQSLSLLCHEQMLRWQNPSNHVEMVNLLARWRWRSCVNWSEAYTLQGWTVVDVVMTRWHVSCNFPYSHSSGLPIWDQSGIGASRGRNNCNDSADDKGISEAQKPGKIWLGDLRQCQEHLSQQLWGQYESSDVFEEKTTTDVNGCNILAALASLSPTIIMSAWRSVAVTFEGPSLWGLISLRPWGLSLYMYKDFDQFQ